jgi:glycosyltransferase involved in cell wall biosynthesis
VAIPRNDAVTSVSAFFPCYNDARSIGTMVHAVHRALEGSVADFEVIVVNDGSGDDSLAVLHDLAEELPRLRIVDHGVNRGYGAALMSGFAAATKQWVFYTDGDAQYDAAEITRCLDAARDDVDVVQGWKIGRGDPMHRRVIGRIYHHGVRLLFRLHVRDTDCDFRLIRRALLQRVTLQSTSGVICVEMMRMFETAGARFVEVPVNHYFRPHGRSQFFRLPQITRAGAQLMALWFRLMAPGRSRATAPPVGSAETDRG